MGIRGAVYSPAVLETQLRGLPGVRIVYPREANAVFVELNPVVADAMGAKGWHFHRMGEAGYRLMCSWATSAAEIERFVEDLAQSQRQ